MPWGDGHGERLGKSGWQRQRDNERTLKAHRRVCHWCGRGGADSVDHVIALAAGGTDDEGNRRPIHADPCHKDKTAREAAAARRARPSRLRPTEPHPGLKAPGGPPLRAPSDPERPSAALSVQDGHFGGSAVRDGALR